MGRKARALAIGAGAAWGTTYWLGRTWGSTDEERRRHLPGDEVVSPARLVTNHAATIPATPEEIWPWLLQVGWHRGGWYTYRWVDRLLFPANRPSADSILPEYQDLKVGDRIPDGPPESDCYFEVELLEPHKYMVLHSRTHLFQQLREMPGTEMDWTWTFHLEPLGERETRFLFRVRANLDPAWLRALYHVAVVPADFLMSRSMCLGLKKRVERG
ncbi:MAG TPA: hypothetical protein VF097_09620 [Actinomycetota bacterium]